MQIFIKTLTGRKQALNFEPENTVLEVKQALQEKEGIQVDQIRYLLTPISVFSILNSFLISLLR